MTFNYYLHSKTYRNGKKPIFLALNNDYKSAKLMVKISILPDYWNKKTQSIKTTKAFPQGLEINTQLVRIKLIAQKVYNSYVAENEEQPEIKELKLLISNTLFGVKDKTKKDLINYYEYYLTTLDIKLNKDGRPFTKAYKSSVKNTLLKLKDFVAIFKKSTRFEKIDYDFYNDFIKYLNSLDYKVNYIGKQIKNINTVLNEATKQGINSNLKFKSFKIVEETTTEIYLNEKELEQMQNLKFEKGSTLDKTRDLFLFSAWTGLRYSDILSFNSKADIKRDTFSFKVQKTQVPITIPILPVAKNILKKYNNVLPILSNPIFNKKLKELGELMPLLQNKVSIEYTRGGTLRKEEITKYKMLKAHTGRRTFATNMVNKKMPIHLIMAITGHKKESNFFKYVKLTAGYKANQFFDEFNKK